IGNDVAITVANTHSNLDLSTMMPVMSQRLQQNIELLANVARVFAHKCIDGITANVDVLQRYAESSPAIATKLNAIIGYEKATERNPRSTTRPPAACTSSSRGFPGSSQSEG